MQNEINFEFSSPASVELDADKRLWNRMMPFCGKLCRIDKDTSAVVAFSCFMYNKSVPLLLSANRVLLEDPLAVTSPSRPPSDFEFKVTYFTDGFTETVELVAAPTSPVRSVDLTVFRGTRTPNDSYLGANCGLNDKVYALGFCPTSDGIFASAGHLSLKTFDDLICTMSGYNADPGFAGSPVVNKRNSLVGIVQGPTAAGNKSSVQIGSTSCIRNFLLGKGLPGFEVGF